MCPVSIGVVSFQKSVPQGKRREFDNVLWVLGLAFLPITPLPQIYGMVSPHDTCKLTFISYLIQ